MAEEPVRGSLPDPALYSLPGLDQWRAFQTGRAPRSPLHRLTGYRLTQADSGAVVLTLPRPDWLQRADGTIDLSVLIELAAAGAATTVTGPGCAPDATSVSVQHLRPATLKGEKFSAKAHVLNVGPRFTVTETVVEDGFGRQVSRALTSAVIRPLDPPPPPLTGALQPVDEPSYATPDPYQRPIPGDAVLSGEAVGKLGGWREAARRWAAGELALPPVAQLLGMRCLDVGDGRTRWSMRTSRWLCADRPHLAAGTILALAQAAATTASASVCGPEAEVIVVSDSLTLLRSVVPDANPVFAEASVAPDGSVLVASVRVSDPHGRPVAVGSQTALVAQRRGTSEAVNLRRALLTVVFTDIVDSTREAERLGDGRWRRVLDEHHAVIRRHLEAFNGREVKTTGDGFLATFESPGLALHCAEAMRDGVRRLGLELRIGLHTGECEISGTDVAGIAVHIAARVQQLAVPGEIAVSSTVRDLVAGSRFRFTDRGRHPLKGIEGDWQLYRLEP